MVQYYYLLLCKKWFFLQKSSFTYCVCAAVCSCPLLVPLCSSDLPLPWHSLGMFMLEYTIPIFIPVQPNWDGRTVEKMSLSNGVKEFWGQKIYRCSPHSSSHNHSKDWSYRLLSHTPFRLEFFLSSLFARLLMWKRKEIIPTAQYQKKKKEGNSNPRFMLFLRP